MTTIKTVTLTWPFKKEKIERFSPTKNERIRFRWKNAVICLGTNIPVLSFSVKTVVWEENMPILHRLSKNQVGKRFIA